LGLRRPGRRGGGHERPCNKEPANFAVRHFRSRPTFTPITQTKCQRNAWLTRTNFGLARTGQRILLRAYCSDHGCLETPPPRYAVVSGGDTEVGLDPHSAYHRT